MIDSELREVDALLGDKGSLRFAARRVAGIDSPERLASWIPTEGWIPVDVPFHVSDVPGLLQKLGGSQLYGETPEIAIRELVQNAVDAIKARTLLEGRPADWGKVTVRLGRDEQGEWIEVQDNGLGMSRMILTNHLLDLGGSFWKSRSIVDEYPGLVAAGMKATGRYGVGFFSVFMLGSTVRVTTRRADAAQRDTLVLEINGGVTARPILRYAAPHEQIRDGGTSVRVWLDPSSQFGLSRKNIGLARLCAALCAASDVDIETEEGGRIEVAVKGRDWTTSSREDFVARLKAINEYFGREAEDGDEELFRRVASNLESMINEDGQCVGRACVVLGQYHSLITFAGHEGMAGAITVGGLLASGTTGIFGILAGVSRRVSRDEATPIVSRTVLKQWASAQAKVVGRIYDLPLERSACAMIIRKCGGDTGELPIALYQGQWLTAGAIAQLPNLGEEVALADLDALTSWKKLGDVRPLDSVLFTHWGWHGLLGGGIWWRGSEWWPDFDTPEPHPLYLPPELRGLDQRRIYFYRTLAGLVLESISTAWGAKLRDVLETSDIVFDSRIERTVAMLGEGELKARVAIIRKPN